MKLSRFRIPLLLVALQAWSAPVFANEGPTKLTFLHLNDTYRVGAVEDGRKGGFGRVVTLVRSLKTDGHHVLITHGGDLLFPSLESQMWSGEQMVEALNFLASLAPAYFVPGNHEFDRRTPDAVISAVRSSRFQWLADNMRFATGEDDVDAALSRGLVFEATGHKIGLLALTLLPRDGGNEREYAIVEGEYIDVARSALARLVAGGAELIVGLTHLHMADDKKLAELKAEFPQLMFIVGGHEHEPEFEPGDENHAVVMKGGSNARAIWRVDVTFEDGAATIKPRLLDIDESIAKDAEYQLIVDKWRERLLSRIPFLASPIGEAALAMDAREETMRNRESSWGSFIADQMRGAFGEPAADMALINSGSLRIDDYIAEDITFEDIGRTFAYSAELRYMTIGGGDFVSLLEAGYRGEGPSKGYFPQVSGFRVCIDRGRAEGQRIVQLQLPFDGRWQNIDPVRDYTLVAPDYLYGGGDGYDFSAARDVSRPASELKYRVLDAIVRAQAQGQSIGRPVDPAQPRIAFSSAPGKPCFRATGT